MWTFFFSYKFYDEKWFWAKTVRFFEKLDYQTIILIIILKCSYFFVFLKYLKKYTEDLKYWPPKSTITSSNLLPNRNLLRSRWSEYLQTPFLLMDNDNIVILISITNIYKHTYIFSSLVHTHFGNSETQVRILFFILYQHLKKYIFISIQHFKKCIYLIRIVL